MPGSKEALAAAQDGSRCDWCVSAGTSPEKDSQVSPYQALGESVTHPGIKPRAIEPRARLRIPSAAARQLLSDAPLTHRRRGLASAVGHGSAGCYCMYCNTCGEIPPKMVLEAVPTALPGEGVHARNTRTSEMEPGPLQIQPCWALGPGAGGDGSAASAAIPGKALLTGKCPLRGSPTDVCASWTLHLERSRCNWLTDSGPVPQILTVKITYCRNGAQDHFHAQILTVKITNCKNQILKSPDLLTS